MTAMLGSISRQNYLMSRANCFGMMLKSASQYLFDIVCVFGGYQYVIFDVSINDIYYLMLPLNNLNRIKLHHTHMSKACLLTSFESSRLIRDWSEGADLDIYKIEPQ